VSLIPRKILLISNVLLQVIFCDDTAKHCIFLQLYVTFEAYPIGVENTWNNIHSSERVVLCSANIQSENCIQRSVCNRRKSWHKIVSYLLGGQRRSNRCVKWNWVNWLYRKRVYSRRILAGLWPSSHPRILSLLLCTSSPDNATPH